MSDSGSQNEYAKPLPPITKLTTPYWEGTQRSELMTQYCHACERPWFPPSEACPECLGNDFSWRAMSGRGKVWSWVQMWQRYFPGFEEEYPYTIALIELAEGPRLYSTLVECEPESIACDMAVEVVFEAVTPEVTLPKFRPSR